MNTIRHPDALPSWTGGFAESSPALSFPNSDLHSLHFLCNMANIDLMTRQQPVLWNQFSWLSMPGDIKSRCFQMFALDLSRLGYDDAGHVCSILCPQQNTGSPAFGTPNVEVAVTGQYDLVDEADSTSSADPMVEGKIWFGPSPQENPLVSLMRTALAHTGDRFPLTREHAIRVRTNTVDDPAKEAFSLRMGQSDRFEDPEFARRAEAWGLARIDVQIGDIVSTGDEIVDDFNVLVMEAFNLNSGNMLSPGNVLSWNIWCNAPEMGHPDEWRDHAEHWKECINADQGSFDGMGADPVYSDGSSFHPVEAQVEAATEKALEFLRKNL